MIGAARESGVLPSVDSPILPLARAFPQAPPTVAEPLASPASGLIAPPIDKVPAGIPRPLWSVMIPTFNCAAYLRETLASVLASFPREFHEPFFNDYLEDDLVPMAEAAGAIAVSAEPMLVAKVVTAEKPRAPGAA